MLLVQCVHDSRLELDQKECQQLQRGAIHASAGAHGVTNSVHQLAHFLWRAIILSEQIMMGKFLFEVHRPSWET